MKYSVLKDLRMSAHLAALFWYLLHKFINFSYIDEVLLFATLICFSNSDFYLCVNFETIHLWFNLKHFQWKFFTISFHLGENLRDLQAPEFRHSDASFAMSKHFCGIIRSMHCNVKFVQNYSLPKSAGHLSWKLPGYLL